MSGVPSAPSLDAGVEGWRIVYSPTLSGARVDAEIARMVAAAAEPLRRARRDRRRAPRGASKTAFETFQHHWFVGAALQVRGLTVAQRRLLDPGLAYIAEQGSRLGAVDYAASVKARKPWARRCWPSSRPAICCSPRPCRWPPFPAGTDYPPQADRGQWNDWTPFTYPFNLTPPARDLRRPAALPRPVSPSGCRSSGPLLGDHRVLRAAHAFEQAQPFRMPEPPNL